MALPAHGLKLFLGLSLAAQVVSAAPQLAFSFDDGPRLAETPLLTPSQRNEALLAALREDDAAARAG